MNEWLLKTLNESLPNLQELTFLKVPSRRGSRGNAVFLVFADGQTEPSFVIKIARDGQNNSNIVREARILQGLEGVRYFNAAVRAAIPRVLHFDPDEGILVENRVNGRKLRGEFDSISDLRSPRLQHLFDNVSLWLDEFHQASLRIIDALHEVPDTESLNSLLRAIHERQFEEIERPEYLITLLEKTLNSIQAPFSVCHGDFNPYNILIVDREVSGVYDWEDWLLAHPLIDRLHFVTVLIGHLPFRDIQQFPERVAQFLESDSHYVQARKLVNKFLADSASKWGYDIEFVNHYYPIYLYVMMKKEVRRADISSMRMWRTLLSLYLRRLECKQPGLVLG